MKRILILSRGEAGKYMSSPGIRALHMAQVLAREVPDSQVTLAVPNILNRPENVPGVRIATYGLISSFAQLLQHDIVIAFGFPPHLAFLFPNKTFIADLFSQYYMEWMELARGESRGLKRVLWMRKHLAYLNMQLTFADFIVCANERQRDTYIGMLSTLGLIDPLMYDRDDTLRHQIDVAPHGVRPDELVHDRQVFRGVHPGVRPTDKFILWNSGTVQWYDPEPFLRALHQLSQERDDIKALFLGATYPGIGDLGKGARFKSAVQLAQELGLYDRSVFFEFGWVPFEEVKNYLLEADLGVCTYFDNAETRYSYRTRFLDLFWAELPIVCTQGDVLAELVDERGLGVTVPPHDADAVAAAIRRLVDDQQFYEQCRENLRELKPCLTWEVALEPLIRFCRDADSFAPPKRDRFLPLLARASTYLLSRLSMEIGAFAEGGDHTFGSVVAQTARALRVRLRERAAREQ